MNESFEPPGPGQWALDRSHYPSAVTPISQHILTRGLERGMKQVFAESGVPAQQIDARFVNGFMYTRLRPLIGGDRPTKKLPPLVVLRIASRIHPEFRRRTKSAMATRRDRPSLEIARQWAETIKPAIVVENLAFQNVDLPSLDDGVLAQHLTDLLDHVAENAERHFLLHGHDLGPIAQYLHHAIAWGLGPDEAIAALAGASPSTSRPIEKLVQLRLMLEAASGTIESLDDVRSISPDAARLVDEYLAEYGSVLATGYDLTERTLGELPTVVFNSIASARMPAPTDHLARAARLQEQVPAEHHGDFDEYLHDARAVMDMRDDNGPQTVEWPVGLLRLALLEAGQRLVDQQLLDDVDHIFGIEFDEAKRLFTSGPPPATTMAERAAVRDAQRLLDPPLTLGPAEPEPPLDVLPAPIARTVGMVQTALKYLGMDGAIESADGLTGAGIGETAYTGRARVADSAFEAIEKLEPGDVLVVRATSPAFNAVLAIAGAVVTTDGGPMSHAAVLARELGIPAIIGASGALDIADGSLVEVDPVAGLVRVIEPG